MKFPKSKLDEMQEKKLAKIETIGLYLVVTALMLSTMVQMIVSEDSRVFLSEFIIMEGLCIYMIVGSLKIGVCDRFLRPTMKNNLILSLIAAVILGVFIGLMDWLYGPIFSMAKDILLFSGTSFAVCFVGNMFLAYLYKKRRQKFDNDSSYQALAAKVGVTVQTLKAIEEGTYNPSIKLCRAICHAMGKTLDELFRKDDEV